VRPDAVSKKSLRPLLPKLRLLARHARFRVRVNTVLGASPPAEALEVARAVVAFGFDANCSLVRDAAGAPAAADAATRAVYDEIRALSRRLPSFLDDDYTRRLLHAGTLAWKCRAGARTFLVCEDGLVHLCQPHFGSPGVPLAAYTVADIRRAFDAPKPCAATCPIAYAHHASKLDRWRGQGGPPIGLAPAPVPAGGRRSAALAVVG
jgi:hypothetical protein